MTDEIRGLAGRLFNETWTLIENDARSSDDDRAMLTKACASRELWSDIGGPAELVTADWQIAHVASLLGHASLALDFATAAYERAAASSDIPAWLLASACEGLARAHAVAGHDAERDSWIGKANDALATEDDAEDRELIESQIATIPR
ncbi:MAG: MerR family transcriptional regulator, thiopeptide resistance regulator [Frankiaceae bacterium]|nr:MerR family transcriptional regulator, thiopeptide resistance regulator [Frankiaceae bacterium]